MYYTLLYVIHTFIFYHCWLFDLYMVCVLLVKKEKAL